MDESRKNGQASTLVAPGEANSTQAKTKTSSLAGGGMWGVVGKKPLVLCEESPPGCSKGCD